jgi:hypothetical protein
VNAVIMAVELVIAMSKRGRLRRRVGDLSGHEVAVSGAA